MYVQPIFTWANTDGLIGTPEELPTIEASYRKTETFVVVPELEGWVLDQLNHHDVSLPTFIGMYTQYNGPVAAIKLIRRLFELGLKEAKDFIDVQYPSEKKIYWESVDFERSANSFLNLVEQLDAPF